MRILHVVSSRQRRGAEVFAGDLIRSLGTDGIEQRVLIRRPGPRDVTFEAPELLLAGRERSVRQRIHALSEIRAWHPEVIQAHGGEALKVSLAIAPMCHAAVVYRRIGLAPPSLRRRLRRKLFTTLVRRADAVVAVSEAVRDEIETVFRMRDRPIVTIPNGVDRNRVAPRRGRVRTREMLGIPPDAPVVISVCALRWEKDPIAHLRTTAGVVRRLPATVHLIAGDGPMRGQLVSEIRCLGLEENVRLLGVRSDIGDLLAASDALLFASRVDGMEGMPAVVIEAGIAGLPVAGYAIAGVPEVVLDGVTGLLCADGHRSELADNLERLLIDERLRAQLGEAARARCSKSYEIAGIASRYVQLYQQISELRMRSSSAFPTFGRVRRSAMRN